MATISNDYSDELAANDPAASAVPQSSVIFSACTGLQVDKTLTIVTMRYDNVWLSSQIMLLLSLASTQNV